MIAERYPCCHWLCVFVAVISISGISPGQTTTKISLTDVSSQCGINFQHTDGGTGKRYIVESVVGGLATFDYDNDGFEDVLLLNNMPLSDAASLTAEVHDEKFRPALYRNNGDFTFTDVTEAAGVGQISYAMGAVVADYDEDGDCDLYVSNFGQNILYRNNGDGTFTNATVSGGLILPDKVGAGCAFLDIDGDNDLDLFVGSYVRFALDQHKMRYVGKYAFHPGPKDYPPSSDSLFRNNGDGSFTDVSLPSGIGNHPSYTMGVVAFDVDDDQDTDIFVANDQRPNVLWINDGQGKFQDQAVLSGLAYDRLGKANGNMGVDIGDVNGDGLMDIFTTTYQDEMPVLYVGVGGGLFMDQTNVAQIDQRLHPHVTWGCGLVDFDNDGDDDLYVACGHFADNIQHIDDRTTVKLRNFMLENRGGKFANVSASAGTGLQVVESSRGAAFEDFDLDGKVDAIVLNANARPLVMRNQSQSKWPGLNIRLVGTRSNRSAVGAQVRVQVGSINQRRIALSGRGYQSHYGSTLHFATSADNAVLANVTWPSGASEKFTIPPKTDVVYLVEGRGK